MILKKILPSSSNNVIAYVKTDSQNPAVNNLGGKDETEARDLMKYHPPAKTKAPMYATTYNKSISD